MLRSARLGWLILIAGCAGRRPAAADGLCVW